jgi:hypothetical protein
MQYNKLGCTIWIGNSYIVTARNSISSESSISLSMSCRSSVYYITGPFVINPLTHACLGNYVAPSSVFKPGLVKTSTVYRGTMSGFSHLAQEQVVYDARIDFWEKQLVPFLQFFAVVLKGFTCYEMEIIWVSFLIPLIRPRFPF